MPIKKPKEPKQPKPKKEKKVKPKKEKKGKPLEEGEEGAVPQKKKKKKILMLLPLVVIIAAAVIVVFVLKGKKAGPEVPEETPMPTPDLPAEYVMDGVTISGLTSEDMTATARQSKAVTYFYEGLVDAGATVAGYVTQLGSEGYSVVNEEFVRSDKPDFTALEGEVLLAKNRPAEEDEEAEKEPEEGEEDAPEEPPTPKVITIAISWEEGGCTITADEAEGTVTSPPRTPGSFGAPAMSLTDALDHLKSMEPSVLGLEGSSMDEYSVYTMDGTVLVDGNPCIRLSVYSNDNPEGTNELEGSYLMTRDGAHIYRLDTTTNTVTEIER